MSTHLEIRTRDGDRWDLLAYRYYGDPYRYEPIIAANPHVPISPVLASGLLLAIPVLEATTDSQDVERLPPWKRGLIDG